MLLQRTAAVLAGLTITATACASSQTNNAALPVPGDATAQVEPDTSTRPGTGTAVTAPSTTPSTTTDDDTTSTDDDATTTSTSAPATTSTTTTTTVPGLDVYDPDCVVEVQSGDSLGLIADAFDDPTVTIATIKAENEIETDVIYAGQVLDVCVDNGLDDITGSERAPNQALVEAARTDAVKRQQEKLNELFDGSGMRELLVDGISGPVTQQRLCAARLALGLDVTRADMEAGSEEEQLLMETDELRQPFTTALLSERWILIDRTCQVMFTGEGDNGITNIFSTSTGSEGYETRDQDRSRAFRFDPALDNGGWHNSTDYPVPEDNPLNGNMYKPLYFDGGQAIHGANNVPTTPQSKGCARLRVDDQETLIAWLGLDELGGATYNERLINVTVNVQGSYATPDAAPADDA
ncbi:LysM peptidoglycan-binding domain-containing protein [Ilumatobacter coccineus]|uniref:LysM domain-containing protein n=1 Tax=Ilumatobacter coccineus (strain NBRC 103263 / KCTC 29153 / YM16-304) TaxID=1313172 RepID=A0A6C7E521_ILUCY|nr:LysM peptidoglycan-binding domain-containing protein [Ilumatobacter coccineus]BAN01681.1 hypothetical protein YM304_13670 [Ilumatobacter coccineus YM16-304]